MLVITIILYIHSIRKLKIYKETEGTIIDFKENTMKMRLNSYENKAISPVVSYRVGENEYEMLGNYYSTSMKKGDKVKILYNIENPSKSTIKNRLYLAPLILSILTICSFVIFIIIKIFI